MHIWPRLTGKSSSACTFGSSPLAELGVTVMPHWNAQYGQCVLIGPDGSDHVSIRGKASDSAGASVRALIPDLSPPPKLGFDPPKLEPGRPASALSGHPSTHRSPS